MAGKETPDSVDFAPLVGPSSTGGSLGPSVLSGGP